jgi:predicted phage-related endonuclease
VVFFVRKIVMNSRQGFLGGSDMYSIVNGKWDELWDIKTGRVNPKDLSDVLPVQMGIQTEDLNIKWFEYETGNIVVDQQKSFRVTHNNVPYKGTIDGFIRESNRLLEAKHSHELSNIQKLVRSYMPQMQLYCYLSGADSCYLSAFFGNSRWEKALVFFCEEYISRLLNLCEEFWKSVECDRKPILFFQPEYPNLESTRVIY